MQIKLFVSCGVLFAIPGFGEQRSAVFAAQKPLLKDICFGCIKDNGPSPLKRCLESKAIEISWEASNNTVRIFNDMNQRTIN
ncbi:MAG: hypothetical protein NT027_02450 [Proteobacteria bacterium]|nr:hypothetical protein [Pseudomonadota bacterium]